MSRTNPDGSYDWTNVHDWGTPEQQQANIDAPDERKVTTVTRWAVLRRGEPLGGAVMNYQRVSREDAASACRDLDALSARYGYPYHPHRVVRLDITISEDDTTAENDRSPAHGEGV